MNIHGKNILISRQIFSILICTFLIAASVQAQMPGTVKEKRGAARGFALMPQYRLLAMPATSTDAGIGPRASANHFTAMAAGPNLQVLGSGTVGRLTKWTGFSSSNSLIGDSTIFENKDGLVGIGTDAPTSRLTVAGTIETTLGGIKFPDGTIQTSAVSGIVTHDQTLQGEGTAAMPLGVAVPLILSGAVSSGNGVITVTNNTPGGPAIFAVGGFSSEPIGGGSGLLSLGGTGSQTPGGVGLVGFGGSSSNSSGGAGGTLVGGVSTNGSGGDGLFAIGALGVGAGNDGGRGIVAVPGAGAGGAIAGLAGEFLGDVEISGNLSKGGGSFKIDHPLDPENKYLYHSFVESPDMKNIYDGIAKLDSNGEAIVELPEWFGALNRDFRYLLTAIGAPAPTLYVAEEVAGNRFKIAGGTPGMKISWQLTGIRKDAYADKHRIPVEENKPDRERGSYLHPEAFNQPAERGVAWARSPQTMRRILDARDSQIKESKQNAARNDR